MYKPNSSVFCEQEIQKLFPGKTVLQALDSQMSLLSNQGTANSNFNTTLISYTSFH
jgi:hypothetical protein